MPLDLFLHSRAPAVSWLLGSFRGLRRADGISSVTVEGELRTCTGVLITDIELISQTVANFTMYGGCPLAA